MPRHLTLADIGRGASRRRRPRPRWVVPLVTALVATTAAGGALAVPAARAVLGSPPSHRAAAPGTVAGVAPGCPKGTTPLVVAAPDDSAALLGRLAREFTATGRDATGRCLAVTVVASPSAEVADALVAGAADGPLPAVWAPSTSLWLPLLRERLAAAGRPPLLADAGTAPVVATSPLVVAMPRPMAEALGWPTARLGWKDLARLATARTGWAEAGHPEWGRFLLAMTDPVTSDAGLAGALSLYHAAGASPRGLAPADVTGATTRPFVAGLAGSLTRRGDTGASVLAGWSRADAAGRSLTYLSALVTDESLVAAYNDGNPTGDPALVGRNPAPRVPLVAIYPQEGMFGTDRPYAVLSAPWVTDAHRAAAAAFLAYLRGPAVQRSMQAHYLRDATGTAGAQAGPAAGLLPNRPATVPHPPDAGTVEAVLGDWARVRR